MSAINFPDTPTVGDFFTVGDTTWEWTGTVWEGFGDLVVGPEGPEGPQGEDGSYFVSTSAPEDPAEGDCWFDSQNGKFYVYYDNYWVEISANKVGPAGPTGSPIAGDGLDLTDETFSVDSTVIRENSSPTFTGLTNAQQKNALIASGYNSASGNFAHDSRVVMTAVASGSTAPTTRPDGTPLQIGDILFGF